MKKRIAAYALGIALCCTAFTGCSTESSKVSHNISQEADNFNVTRKLTVINARTDNVLMEMIGTFSLKNNAAKRAGNHLRGRRRKVSEAFCLPE